MTQPGQEASNTAEIPEVETRTGRQRQPGQNRPLQEQALFVDGSGPLFSMYLRLAGEEDKKMTDNWKGDADGILIFTGLFSAAVAALVAVSVQDLKPNSQDISAFYLANIYQILADSNASQVIPATLPYPSIPFSPPTSAVWVNSLWFLSLVISLTCALLATLLQQWARRYMRVTQTRYSTYKRARIRAFFAEGVKNLHLPWAVEALPTLLHLSLFLFFAGLAVFLFNINHTVFKVAISWIGLCTGVYMCITFMPMFRHDSPYYAPLSSSVRYLYTGILFTLSRILEWIAYRCNVRDSIWDRMWNLRETYEQRKLCGIEKEFEETACKLPSKIDGRALMWTFESSDEDHELEEFFTGIPGFCSSTAVYNPRSILDRLRMWDMREVFSGFLERTWSSNLVSDDIKTQRLVICIRAIDAARIWNAAENILTTFFRNRPMLLQSVELGHSLMSGVNNDDRKNSLLAQGIIACIIAKAPQRNERWFSLTTQQLGISGPVLRGYLNHGDSVLLANLIDFTRQLIRKDRDLFHTDWQIWQFPLSDIFRQLVSNYRVQDTLPELQDDFCVLWDELVLQRRDRGDYLLLLLTILQGIRPIYLALHHDQGSSSTWRDPYSLCIPSQHIHSASDLNKINDGEMMEMIQDPVITSPALLYRDAVSPIIQAVATYDPLTSPMWKSDHTIPHPADEPPRNEVPDMLRPSTQVILSHHPSPLNPSRFSHSTAAGPIPGTDNHSMVSSMARPTSCPHPSGDDVPRHTGNMIITLPPPSFLHPL